MTHLLIDFDVYIHHPEIVCYKHEDFKIWILDRWLTEETFSKYAARDDRWELLKESNSKNLISIYTNNIEGYFKSSVDHTYYNEMLYDQYQKMMQLYPADDIQVVAYDLSIPNVIRLAPKQAIKDLKSAGAVIDPVLNLRVKAMNNDRTLGWLIFCQFLTLFIISVSFKWILEHIIGNILLAFSIFLATLFLVYTFYKLRRKNRFYYGFIELLFGLFLIGKVAFISNIRTLTQIDYFSIMSGAYVIIRGLDNIETGLKFSFRRKTFELWDKFF